MVAVVCEEVVGGALEALRCLRRANLATKDWYGAV